MRVFVQLIIAAMVLHTGQGHAQVKCPLKNDEIPIPAIAENAFLKKLRGSISIPLKPFEVAVNGEKLNLKYVKYNAITSESHGTILSLCGGPGVSCIPSYRPEEIPPQFDFVTLDYIGIGQNQRFQKPLQMSIEAQAQAVAGLARQLNEPNLIIYGHSFGTTVATAAAAKLTGAGDVGVSSTVLRGVVLEGVAGKGRTRDYLEDFIAVAATAWAKLSESEQASFKQAYPEITRGMRPSDKSNFDTWLLMNAMEGPSETVKQLKQMSANSKEYKAEAVKLGAFWATFAHGPGRPLFLAAGCQILRASTSNAEVRVFGGTVPVHPSIPDQLCVCPTVAKVWDPAEYQILNIPVLYIDLPPF